MVAAARELRLAFFDLDSEDMSATSMISSDCRLEKTVLPGQHQLELNEVYLLAEVCRPLRSGALQGTSGSAVPLAVLPG